MSDYIYNFQFLWEYKIAPHWSTIIPLLLMGIAFVWFFVVYARGKFRFMPALAIARVTILDSIGRMEVIVLLAIGMMIVGVNGIIPNTTSGRDVLNTYKDVPYIQERLEDLSGISSFDPGEEFFNPLEGEYSSGGGQVSVFEEEFGNVSAGGGEPLTGEANGGGGFPPGEMTRADELAAEMQESTLEALIWQGAFLVADFFVALIGFVLAMVVLPTEMNRGVTLSILPKPVSREEYVFGKAAGIWVIVTGCFWIMTLELWLIHSLFGLIHGGSGPLDWHLFEAMALFPLKYATLILIIMGLTLRMPEVPAGIIGVALFATGHFVDRIYEIATSPGINPVIGFGIRVAYWILPHLSQVTFSILDRDATLLTNWPERWGWIWQIMIYNIIMLSMLSWLFRRRSL